MIAELFISFWAFYYCTYCSLISYDLYINRNNPEYSFYIQNTNVDIQNIENSIVY